MKRAAVTPSLLRDLRSLKVVVVHPRDADGDELLAQLRRIGCEVESAWPSLDCMPANAGLVFMAVRPETLSLSFPWLGDSTAPPVIAVVTYENPITIEAVLQLNAVATIPSPVRSFGLLTTIAIAVSQARMMRNRERYIDRLEQKQAKVRTIQQAKQIMMDTHKVSEEEAYQMLRSRAMLKREVIESVAGEIVRAHETLSL
jgi:AmiR/NasT family two-component response regulator